MAAGACVHRSWHLLLFQIANHHWEVHTHPRSGVGRTAEMGKASRQHTMGSRYMIKLSEHRTPLQYTGDGAQHEVTTVLLNLKCSSQLQILWKRIKLVSNVNASWDGMWPSATPGLAAFGQVTHTGMLCTKSSQRLDTNPQEKKCRGKNAEEKNAEEKPPLQPSLLLGANWGTEALLTHRYVQESSRRQAADKSETYMNYSN